MFCRLIVVAISGLAFYPVHAADPALNHHGQALVVNVENAGAISDFQPNAAVVQTMVDSTRCHHAHRKYNQSWPPRGAVSSPPGMSSGVKVTLRGRLARKSGSRPAVVAAVIQGLLAAGLPPTNIVIWDKHTYDLRDAGYYDLAGRFGVRVAGSAETGYDPANFYLPDTVVIGSLVWGDLEFNQTNAVKPAGNPLQPPKSSVSRSPKSSISRRCSTRRRNLASAASFTSLALGSVDNTFRRFPEVDPDRLAVAVPGNSRAAIAGRPRRPQHNRCTHRPIRREWPWIAALFRRGEPALVQPRSGGARHAGHSGTGWGTACRRCPANKTPVGALCQRQSASTG